MKNTPEPKLILRFLVQCACTPEQFEALRPIDRARLLEEAAQVLPADEAEIARRTAALYRQSDAGQKKFVSIMEEGKR